MLKTLTGSGIEFFDNRKAGKFTAKILCSSGGVIAQASRLKEDSGNDAVNNYKFCSS